MATVRPLGSASNHTFAEAPNQMAQPAREERASENAPPSGAFCPTFQVLRDLRGREPGEPDGRVDDLGRFELGGFRVHRLRVVFGLDQRLSVGPRFLAQRPGGRTGGSKRPSKIADRASGRGHASDVLCRIRVGGGQSVLAVGRGRDATLGFDGHGYSGSQFPDPESGSGEPGSQRGCGRRRRAKPFSHRGTDDRRNPAGRDRGRGCVLDQRVEHRGRIALCPLSTRSPTTRKTFPAI